MSKIPADVDELMWTIAESNNSQSVREFGVRFPELRSELVSRIRIISEFKGAKNSVGKSAPAPFKRRPVRAQKNQISWQIIASTALVIGLVLIGLGYVAFGGKKAEPIQTGSLNPASVTGAAPQSEHRGIVYRSSLPGSGQAQGPAAGSTPNSGGAPINPAPNGNWANSMDPNHVGPVGSNGQVAAQLKPITVVIKNARLSDALTIIAAQAKIQIQVAPGLKDRTVSIDYEQALPQDILNDLGAQYGFTPFYQGNDLYVIIPARQSNGTKVSNPDSVPSGPKPTESDPTPPGAHVKKTDGVTGG